VYLLRHENEEEKLLLLFFGLLPQALKKSYSYELLVLHEFEKRIKGVALVHLMTFT